MTLPILDPTDPSIRLGTAQAALERHYFDATESSASGFDTAMRVRQLALGAAYARALALLFTDGSEQRIRWQQRHDDLARQSWELANPAQLFVWS